ncbi:MAG: hypothetical protein KY459_10780 [Acidobacteria bacterium]|nr:hypothetical protein [Acidobacteriota bacterium]
MEDRDLHEALRRYEDWRRARRLRRESGSARISAEELSTLAGLEDLVGTFSTDTRNRWLDIVDELRGRNESDDCRCGHHRSQHLDGRSCDQVVGCSTVCDCGAFEPGARAGSEEVGAGQS